MNKNSNKQKSFIVDLREVEEKQKEDLLKNNIENKSKPKIFYLVFGYGIKAQIVKIRKKFFLTRQMALISTFVFLLVGSTVFFSANYFAKGATYGWIQASWGGGADTTAVANHTDNRDNWTQYYSGEDNITVDGNNFLTLSGSTASWNEADDADFNAGAPTDIYVNGGMIQLKKPDGASCTSVDECSGGFCTASVCASS